MDRILFENILYIVLSSSDCERNFINSLQIQTVLAVDMFPLQLMK